MSGSSDHRVFHRRSRCGYRRVVGVLDDDCSIYVHDEEIVWEDEDTVEWRCRNCGAEGWDPR